MVKYTIDKTIEMLDKFYLKFLQKLYNDRIMYTLNLNK